MIYKHHHDYFKAHLLALNVPLVSQPQWLTWPKSADRETEPLDLIQKPTNPKATSRSLSKPRALYLLLHENIYASNTDLLA